MEGPQLEQETRKSWEIEKKVVHFVQFFVEERVSQMRSGKMEKFLTLVEIPAIFSCFLGKCYPPSARAENSRSFLGGKF